MSNLLPCPFCGARAEISSHPSCDCCGKAWNGCVSCTQCSAEVSHFDTTEEAVTAWNRRSDIASKQLVSIVEPAKTLLNEIASSGTHQTWKRLNNAVHALTDDLHGEQK